jgi:hypothetical protein
MLRSELIAFRHQIAPPSTIQSPLLSSPTLLQSTQHTYDTLIYPLYRHSTIPLGEENLTLPTTLFPLLEDHPTLLILFAKQRLQSLLHETVLGQVLNTMQHIQDTKKDASIISVFSYAQNTFQTIQLAYHIQLHPLVAGSSASGVGEGEEEEGENAFVCDIYVTNTIPTHNTSAMISSSSTKQDRHKILSLTITIQLRSSATTLVNGDATVDITHNEEDHPSNLDIQIAVQDVHCSHSLVR